MKRDNKIAGILVGIALLVGMVVSTSVTANAQYGRNWDGYPNWGGSLVMRQTALNAGYNEGQKEGANDRSRGRISNPSDFRSYQNATKDYNSRYGDRELYRRYFQMAFQNGYSDGVGTTGTYNGGYNNGSYNNGGYNNGGYNNGTYNNGSYNNGRDPNRNRNHNYNRRGRNWDGYPNLGGSLEMRQTALNAGYNDGNKAGRNDRSRGRTSDVSRFSSYRNATRDYNANYGDRELYRRYYREAFQTGYNDGFEGY